MEVFPRSQTISHQNSDACIIRACSTTNNVIDGAVADISGRYPAQGFAVNERSHELVYVVRGQGLLLSEDVPRTLQEGDCLCISPGECFAWDGDMTLFISCAPSFDPKQYKHIDSTVS